MANDTHARSIAIIGMAGRFPGADDVRRFWRNIRDGVASLTQLDDDELRAAGVSEQLIRDPAYVKVKPVLADIDKFDAAFFGLLPREAEITDPQHRMFLECAFHALEDAGYGARADGKHVGVYAGTSISTYLLRNLLANPELRAAVDMTQLVFANDKDHLATRVGYKLDLKGPCVSVNSACSTSLVAVHMACRALLGYQCDMALAGGAAVFVPQKEGYLYKDGGMASPDGRCRAFDAEARGTVFGSGVGVVVLKRFEDAVEDGDFIYALIRGGAVNNDGSAKVGYTAPSVEGQAEVITEALSVAGVEPRSVSYIEAHGTGTALGDPIEIRALKKAFDLQPSDSGPFCAIGSVKTNIGHLDAASGVTSLIKTALALKEKELPPSLNFRRPNPEIDFNHSPFRVQTALTPWPTSVGPRRAGVSSFGIGGTNAHLVLEEAPAREPAQPSARSRELIVLSAKSEAALGQASVNLAEFLAARRDMELADVAFSLSKGREAFEYRRAVLARNTEEAAQMLREPAAAQGLVGRAVEGERTVAYLLPGQGAQHVDMGRGLYATAPPFRALVDRCADQLAPRLGLDLRRVLFPEEGERAWAIERIQQTAVTQPALFVIEYALAELWSAWGIRPSALIGHSVGEYVAACLSGVLTLEDALALIAERGRLMQALPPGAMLAVPLDEDAVGPYLGEGLAIAAVNAPGRCVVSGEISAIEALAARLTRDGIEAIRLRTSHAFHSPMMDPILAPFAEVLRKVKLEPPRIPFISNVSGTWISAAEATDPGYWVRQLRATVRFADGLRTLAQGGRHAMLEVGPGHTLAKLAARQPNGGAGAAPVVTSLPGPNERERQQEEAHAIAALGRLWIAGVPVGWSTFYRRERRHRVPLPGYPFERRSHWIDPAAPATVNARRAEPALQEHGADSGAQRAPFPAREAEEGKGALAAAAGDAAGPEPGRRTRLEGKLRELVARASGIATTDIEPDHTFLDLGIDSLTLIQFNRALKAELGADVSFRQLFDDFPSVAALASHLDGVLPSHVLPPRPAARAAQAPAPPVAAQAALPSGPGAAISADVLEGLSRQVQALATQIEMLRGGSPLPLRQEGEEKARAADLAARPMDPGGSPGLAQASDTSAKTSQPGATGEMSAEQRASLDRLIERYTKRTAESKRLAQRHREKLADARVSMGFQRTLKEIVYPLVIARAAGARVWDADGNEYVDLLMGFGVNLFGHAPAFVTEALRAALDQQLQMVGPQSPLAGPVAELFCEVTGAERATFCNTGSEAVMTAIRLARTATGRDRVALFHGSYHGNFDSVLVRTRTGAAAEPHSAPMALGVPQRAVEDMVVLAYGSDEALDYLRRHGHEIAAVLVEPVQARRPDLQPNAFLKELRQITAAMGTLLVFDEVVTGLRVHPRGAQAWFGIQADLATYGKVLGGGMPIGVVAGKATYMDAIDGGLWSYGDTSFPRANQTAFAGTFCKHPLAIVAARAVLEHVRSRGPRLQEELSARTTSLARTLSRLFEERRAPVRVHHFSSLFKFTPEPGFRWLDLFFYHLRQHGVSVWEERAYFLSTAHTDEDIERVVQAAAKSVDALQEGGFLPRPDRRAVVASSALAPRAPVPLTEAQREVWVAAQLGDDVSCAFNTVLALRLRGPLDKAALRGALRFVVGRHEALRTTFDPSGKHQRFAPDLTLDFPLIDLSDTSPPEREQRAAELLDKEARTPFDLVHGPLLRASLLALGRHEHLLAMTAHHIACDGLALDVVMRDLMAAYRAETAGERPQLAEPMPYSEYVAFQESERSRGAIAATEAYWLERFKDGVPILDLPLDRPRPRVLGASGARETLVVGGALPSALKRVGASVGATPFAVLLACFKVLLHRLSGHERLLVGVPSAGQSLVGERALVGHCVNLLPILSEIDPSSPFVDYLAELKQALLGTHEHRNITAGTLLERLDLPRDPSRPALVAATFNLDQAPPPLAFAGLTVENVSTPKRFVQFELVLNVVDDRTSLRFEWDYSADLFEGATIQRWLGHLERLMESVALDPRTPIGRLALVRGDERRSLLHGFARAGAGLETQAPRRETLASATIHRWFEDSARKTPGAVAVAASRSSGSGEGGAHPALTYGELNARANRLARHLRAIGVKVETRVGICLDRTPTIIVGLLAVLKAGGAYVPIDPTFPAERVALMLDDAGIDVLLTERALERSVAASGLEMPSGRPRAVVVLDRDEPSLDALPDSDLPGGAEAHHAAYVIYTSGSTGRPKGVAVTHGNVTRLFTSTAALFGFGSEDVWTCCHSYAFDFSVWETWGALFYGGRLVVVPYWVTRSPGELLTLLRDERVTVLNQTPSAFRELVAVEGELAPRDGRAAVQASSLRYVIFGGEALDFLSLATWFERHGDARPRLVNMYGITETTVHVTYRAIERRDLNSAASRIGAPIGDLDLYILDRHLEPAPIGVAGELYVAGPGVARGYLGRPELTAERFIPNPHATGPAYERLYRTGDLARRLPDGDIEYLGRIDHQVQLRGFRVELGEIEAQLRACSGVRDAGVVARDETSGSMRLVAYVVTEGGVTLAALREHLGRRLPEYMIPSLFVEMAALPKTATGKLDRKALPAPDPSRVSSAQATYEAPRDQTEKTLADIWAETLGVAQVGVHNNFFELGGDSIINIQIVARARQVGVHFAPKDLYAHPTVAELSTFIASRRADSAPAAPSALAVGRDTTEGPVPLTPIQRWFFARALLEPDHFNQSLLLEVPANLDPTRLRRALAALIDHHEALRLRFAPREDGAWVQHVKPDAGEADLGFETLDLTQHSATSRDQTIREATLTAQRQIDLARGPLVQARLFRLPDAAGGDARPDRLLLVIHHLVVDGVTWRLLLDDLETAYGQLKQGDQVVLPARTSSFQCWARRLTEYAASSALAGERAYWLRPSVARAAPLPIDMSAGEASDTVASERRVRVKLDAARTSMLLQSAHHRHESQVSDVLIAALALTLSRWSGSPTILIDLEGHGREEGLFDGVDLSRTAGWFTTLFPAQLRVDAPGDLGATLRSVREQLRGIPNRGIGYGVLRYLSPDPSLRERLGAMPQAQVLFNYLGQMGRAERGVRRLFGVATRPDGADQSPRTPRSHLLEINALVDGSALEIDLGYSERRHRRETIERLAAELLAALASLIDHSQSGAADTAWFTPSDFPDAALTQEDLDQVLKEIEGSGGQPA